MEKKLKKSWNLSFLMRSEINYGFCTRRIFSQGMLKIGVTLFALSIFKLPLKRDAYALSGELDSSKDEPKVSFKWLVSSREKEDLKTLLIDNKALLNKNTEAYQLEDPLEDHSHASFAPLVYLVGSITVVYLADSLLKLWKDSRSGGLIISVDNNNSLTIREHSALDRGSIVFVDKNSSVERLEQKERSKIVEVLNKLIKK